MKNQTMPAREVKISDEVMQYLMESQVRLWAKKSEIKRRLQGFAAVKS